jgi:hypothetical protein
VIGSRLCFGKLKVAAEYIIDSRETGGERPYGRGRGLEEKELVEKE